MEDFESEKLKKLVPNWKDASIWFVDHLNLVKV